MVHGRCRRIKSQRAEATLPQFDLGKKVGRKIGLQKMRRAVVLVVVDAADFDGSLPRAALEGLFANIEGYQVRRRAYLGSQEVVVLTPSLYMLPGKVHPHECWLLAPRNPQLQSCFHGQVL